jgi:mannosyltransferase OCH1-like enzyme
MIPKVIHYCWFGGKKKSKLIKDCIKSWGLHLPDYKIVEWNERNTDLSHPFLQEVYKLKKWAFVSDYVRLKVIHDYGGIYLDTDMMVLKSFEGLLINKSFFGAEDLKFVNCAIMGAEKNHWFIKNIIQFYDNIHFSSTVNLGLITIPRIVTEIFRKEFNYQNDFNELIVLDDLTIFPARYFYSFPYTESDKVKAYKDYLSTDSYAVHLWTSSWVQYSEFYYIRKRKYVQGLKIILKSVFINGKIEWAYFRKILSCFKESLIIK